MGERHGFKVVRIQGAAASRRSYQSDVYNYQFKIHAGILIPGHVREQFEKLLRSMLRSSLANGPL